MNKAMPKLLFVVMFGCLINNTALAATFKIINLDFPGEGFKDGTPVAPVTGNNGTTLGQQRLNALQAATDFWSAMLQSDVEIEIDAEMNPEFCTATTAVLGFAGPNSPQRDFPNRPFPNTYYPQALANSLAGFDLDPLGSDKSDMAATFNSDIDNSTCLGSTDWWYGIGGSTPPSDISFYETALHEIAHGLGFLTFVNLNSGEKFMSRNDHFMRLLKDFDSGKIWPSMTDVERVSSAVDTGDLVWIGAEAKAAASGTLTAGLRSNGDIRMYAPNPLEPGSSVSHWDTALSPDELMEPSATPTTISDITIAAFEDMGWNLISGGGGPGGPDDPGGPGDPSPPNIVPFIFPLLLGDE